MDVVEFINNNNQLPRYRICSVGLYSPSQPTIMQKMYACDTVYYMKHQQLDLDKEHCYSCYIDGFILRSIIIDKNITAAVSSGMLSIINKILEPKSMSFAANIIASFLPKPIAKIELLVDNSICWSKFIWKFPYKDFPDAFLPQSYFTTKKLILRCDKYFNANLHVTAITVSPKLAKKLHNNEVQIPEYNIKTHNYKTYIVKNKL